KQTGDYKTYIENYKQSIRNLAECDIRTVCYNFMPMTDWTRTTIDQPLDDGATALRFDATVFAAFGLFILKREGAEQNYSSDLREKAHTYYKSLDPDAAQALTDTILLELPGHEKMPLEKVRGLLDEYRETDDQKVRSDRHYYLQEIIPVAEEHGVRMSIHPDHPLFPLFGRPSI